LQHRLGRSRGSTSSENVTLGSGDKGYERKHFTQENVLIMHSLMPLTPGISGAIPRLLGLMLDTTHGYLTRTITKPLISNIRPNTQDKQHCCDRLKHRNCAPPSWMLDSKHCSHPLSSTAVNQQHFWLEIRHYNVIKYLITINYSMNFNFFGEQTRQPCTEEETNR